MFVSDLRLKRVEFPDPAGQYQREERPTALIRELGSNYSRYHAFLAERLEAFGHRPRREEYQDDDSFREVWADIQETVRAEALLRACRAYLLEGRRLDMPLDPDGPRLVGKDDRLVSIE